MRCDYIRLAAKALAKAEDATGAVELLGERPATKEETKDPNSPTSI